MSAVKLLHNNHPIRLVGQKGSTWIDHISKTCPSLVGPEAMYYPTPYLFNGHLQTGYASFYTGSPVEHVVYQREILQLKDNGQVALDWSPPFADKPMDTTPTVVCLHGLTGGSHESYVRSVIEVITKPPFNYRAIVMNARGCSESEITTPQLFSGAFTDDIRATVEHVRQILGNETPLIAIGFSLGANILVKYLGEEGDNAPFRAALSIANPFDLHRSSLCLDETPLGRHVYSPSMATNLKNVFAKHASMMTKSDRVSGDEIMASVMLREFDEACTRKMFGYASVDDYYHDASSSKYIDRVRVPLLCLQALDDPIAPAPSIPWKEIKANPHVLLATTDTGGHLGWFEYTLRPSRWMIKPITEFIVAMANTTLSTTSEKGSS